MACLQSQGKSFIGRYYSRTTQIPGKKLTQAEAQLILSGGLHLVTVYEDGPTSYSYFSAARGTQDAQGALQQASAIGQPAGTAIYFTVDYNCASSEISANITAYFQALNQTIQTYKVGVYGSGAVCAAIRNAGLAKYAWLCQSTAWTGYTTFTDWSIKQGAEGTVCGLNADSDVAQNDFGAFNYLSYSAAVSA